MAMQSKEAPNSLIGSGPGSPEPPPSPLQPEPASLAPSTPDLSEIPGTELLKMPEKTAIGVELNGELYGSVYRQLQIKKEKCQDFYNNIIRVFRNKNWILIVRSSEKSLEKTTDVLLRAYGSVVWIAGSEWQMDADELDEGEEQLMYVKGEGQENPDNARFHPIFVSLWRQMRNAICTPRPVPAAGRRRRQGKQPSLTPTVTTPAIKTTNIADGEDTFMTDKDDIRAAVPLSPILPSSPPSPTRVHGTRQHEQEAVVVQDDKKPKSEEPRKPATMMTPAETEQGIADLIEQLAKVREESDPRVFAELWYQLIMRVEELDAGNGPTLDELMNPASVGQAGDRQAGIAAPVAMPTSTSMSNEPFMTSGIPGPPGYPLSSLLPPTLPAVMSVYISTSQLPCTWDLRYDNNSIATSMGTGMGTGMGMSMGMGTDLPGSSSTSPLGSFVVRDARSVSAPNLASAYHWPSAPVQVHDMVKFFEGLEYRTEHVPRGAGVLGWVFSYGWNDTCRFVWSGLGRTVESGTTAATTTTTTTTTTAAASGVGVGVGSAGSHGASGSGPGPEDADAMFRRETLKWSTIGLAWQDFQNDLRHAATKQGVRVWRMKVCVVVVPGAGAAPAGTTGTGLRY